MEALSGYGAFALLCSPWSGLTPLWCGPAMLKGVDCLPMAKPVCNYPHGDTPRLSSRLCVRRPMVVFTEVGHLCLPAFARVDRGKSSEICEIETQGVELNAGRGRLALVSRALALGEYGALA